MVADWKVREVKEIEKRIDTYPVVGIVGISGIPSRQFQSMRKGLGEDVELRVTRTNLIRRALGNKDQAPLSDHMEGSVGLVFNRWKTNTTIVSWPH